jgi:predicted RNase H-like nuclease (RuvC/YqgF family)
VNLHELEQHYGMLVHDKEGWNELIKSKNNEISELMQKCLQLETAVTRFGELESKCVFFAAENDKLNTVLLDRTREIAILKDKLSEIERLRTIDDKSLQLMKETERLAAELELAFR